jgi:hypothetical protein
MWISSVRIRAVYYFAINLLNRYELSPVLPVLEIYVRIYFHDVTVKQLYVVNYNGIKCPAWRGA